MGRSAQGRHATFAFLAKFSKRVRQAEPGCSSLRTPCLHSLAPRELRAGAAGGCNLPAVTPPWDQSTHRSHFFSNGMGGGVGESSSLLESWRISARTVSSKASPKSWRILPCWVPFLPGTARISRSCLTRKRSRTDDAQTQHPPLGLKTLPSHIQIILSAHNIFLDIPLIFNETAHSKLDSTAINF